MGAQKPRRPDLPFLSVRPTSVRHEYVRTYARMHAGSTRAMISMLCTVLFAAPYYMRELLHAAGLITRGKIGCVMVI